VIAALIASRFLLAFGAALVARRIREPLAVALLALAILDASMYAGPPPRLYVGLYAAWPGVAATLAWRTWRGSAWPALAFALYAAAVAFAPWSWRAHPQAYDIAMRLPWWAGASTAAVAWWRSQEKPDGHAAYAAGLMAWSNAIDALLGALAFPFASWWVARGLSVVTQAWIAVILVRWARSRT
jgi:hypothetical protein